MTRPNMIQSNFLKKAEEKARIRDITVNGYKATVVFSEYKAPDDMVEAFKQYDGSDGHFYYVTFYVWNRYTKSYYTRKNVSVSYEYSTTKEEGNALFTEIKKSKSININFSDY